MSFSRKIAWTVLLALLAALGNQLRLPLLFGVDLVWGSIPVLVALVLLGRSAGLLVALVGGLVLVPGWGHPYGLLMFVLEALAVGLLLRRVPLLAASDALFWLLLGAPLGAWIYSRGLGFASETVQLILLKQIVNGVFNALLASLCVLGLRLAPGWGFGGDARISLRTLLFTMLLAAGLGSGMASLVAYGRLNLDALHADAGVRLDGVAQRVALLLHQGVTPPLAVAAVSSSSSQRIVFDAHGAVLARAGGSAHPDAPGLVLEMADVHPGLSLWQPAQEATPLARWRRGYYQLELPGPDGLRVVVERPAAPFIAQLERMQLAILALLSAIALAVVGLAWLLSYWLTRPVAAIVALQHELPQHMLAGRHPTIAGSAVVEFDQLRRALQSMATIVADNVNELQQARRDLAQQVDQRTQELARRSEALRHSKQLLDSLIENIPAMVFLKRAEDLRFELLNRAGERLLGYSRAELLGRNDYDFFPREQADAFTARDREVLNSGQVLDIPEEAVTTADGRVRYLRTLKIGLRDERGAPTHLLGISIDISERHDYEQTLSEFQSSLDRTLDGVLLFDAQHLGFFYANQGAVRLTGYTQQELLGMHCHELIEDATARGLRTQLAPLQYGERDALTRETHFRCKNGQLLPVEVSFQYLLMNGPGRQPRFVAIARDIRERQRSQAVLRNSEARLQLALAATRTSLWDASPLSGEITLDSRWAELRGEPPHETRVPFATLYALVPPAEAPLIQQRMLAALKGDAPDYLCEHRVRHHDGHWIWIESRGRVVERDAEGRAVRMIGTNTDISERKRVDQLKSEFVSTVSHELRTPLTSIIGALGLLSSGQLGALAPPMREMLTLATRNSQRLAQLINDLLDMEKLTAGKIEFDLRAQELRPLLLQAIDAMRAYGAQFGVSFALEAPAQDARVRVDADRLQQVLANLLSNAVKFSPAGGQVEVRARRAGARLRLEVIDHGAGVPQAFRAKIFQKFSQADASDARQKGGTGLGLAISKEIIERMNGSIGFESQQGQGACFYFELPLAEPAPAAREDGA